MHSNMSNVSECRTIAVLPSQTLRKTTLKSVIGSPDVLINTGELGTVKTNKLTQLIKNNIKQQSNKYKTVNMSKYKHNKNYRMTQSL